MGGDGQNKNGSVRRSQGEDVQTAYISTSTGNFTSQSHDFPSSIYARFGK